MNLPLFHGSQWALWVGLDVTLASEGLVLSQNKLRSHKLRECWQENKKGDRMVVADPGIAHLLFSNWSSCWDSLIRRIHWAST